MTEEKHILQCKTQLENCLKPADGGNLSSVSLWLSEDHEAGGPILDFGGVGWGKEAKRFKRVMSFFLWSLSMLLYEGASRTGRRASCLDIANPLISLCLSFCSFFGLWAHWVFCPGASGDELSWQDPRACPLTHSQHIEKLLCWFSAGHMLWLSPHSHESVGDKAIISASRCSSTKLRP